MRYALPAVLMLLGAPVAAGTIDFEGFSAGDNVTSVSVAGATASVSATGGIDQAWVFDTDNPTGGDFDLAAPFLDSGATPGNVLIIQENDDGVPDDAGAGGTITFVFDRAVRFLGFDAFDDFGIDVSGSEAGQVFTATNGRDRGDATFGGFDWVTTSLTFDFNGTGPGGRSGAIDNLQIAAIPVPAGLPLLALGLGLLGWAGRRRS